MPRAAESFLEDQADQIRANGKVAETHFKSGDPDKEILRTAEWLGVGMIVIGSRDLDAIS